MSGRRKGKLGIALAGGGPLFAEFERAMIPERTSGGLAAPPRRGAHRRSVSLAASPAIALFPPNSMRGNVNRLSVEKDKERSDVKSGGNGEAYRTLRLRRESSAVGFFLWGFKGDRPRRRRASTGAYLWE